ncbi:MAG: L-threonylcarbamoyladenylate synthase [Coriobacteriales bacterium]|nr:L-threonylcarbamoyladenylate synthase [Coriobacteriales bacterium]
MEQANVQGQLPQEDVTRAALALKAGRPVIFPTETVYGLGVMVSKDTSPEELYKIKRRDADKPIAWLVPDASALDRYGLRVPEWARALAGRYWPGPLTLVVPTSAAVSSRWCSRNRTVALRVPADETAQQLLAEVDAPLATSSANIQGRIAPRAPWHIARSVRRQVACVVERGRSPQGVASTVVDATGPEPVILREGPITPQMIEEACGVAPRLASPGESGIAVGKELLEVPSTDGSNIQRGFIWAPAEVLAGTKEPVGTVQLVHGMVEFVDRYDAFARFLARHGYAVYGCDLPGHGDTAQSPRLWGHLPLKGGADLLVNDTLAVCRAVSARFSGAPRFIFCHSMGTFVVRALLSRFDDLGTSPDGYPLPLTGVVLSGTGNQPVALSRFGNFLARLLATFKGERAHSPFFNNLTLGSYNKAFEPVRTSCDWLSVNEENVDAYLDDPRNTYSFTLGGYAALTTLTREAASARGARHVPRDLPLLFIAGSDDPVGASGEGVKAAARLYRQAGVSDVGVRLIDGCRHEILNEDNRDETFVTILEWFDQHREARS